MNRIEFEGALRSGQREINRSSSSPPAPRHVGSSRKQAPTVAAQHSAGTPDWGTPHDLRSFAARVLKPASWSAQSIDVDGASSAYWQRAWADDDRPRVFLDGSPGQDTTSLVDWEAARVRLTSNGKAKSDARIGSVFENPPGLDGGEMIQLCWSILVDLWWRQQIQSVFWVGFNIGQFRTLIPHDMDRPSIIHPLYAGAGVCSIIPGRRSRYLAHPEVMIASLGKRLESKKGKTAKVRKERQILERRIAALGMRGGNDEPVAGESPSHDGYVTILWSRNPSVCARQKREARAWLDEQIAGDTFERYAAIGDAP